MHTIRDHGFGIVCRSRIGISERNRCAHLAHFAKSVILECRKHGRFARPAWRSLGAAAGSYPQQNFRFNRPRRRFAENSAASPDQLD